MKKIIEVIYFILSNIHIINKSLRVTYYQRHLLLNVNAVVLSPCMSSQGGRKFLYQIKQVFL